MIEKYIELKDKTKIYTNYIINKEAPTIMIIHGGPGQGFWDQIPFIEKLTNYYNVIAFDERGVNKSDEINDNFTSEVLIDDIEEIRKHFNLDKIILIGHSYGGHLLLRYIHKYPNHVLKAIFLCPSFDFFDSLRTVIKGSIEILKQRDFKDLELLEKASISNSFDDIFRGLSLIPEDIQNIVYGFNKISEDIMNQAMKNLPSEEEQSKSMKHQQFVFQEEEITKDLTNLFLDINVDTTLIVGEDDPVCSLNQINKYNNKAKYGKTIIIKNSGHFPYLDSIDELIKNI